MTYRDFSDPELDRSTNRVMTWAAGLTLAMVAIFPLYRLYEPTAREDNRASQLASLEVSGESIWSVSCADCHGGDGEGGSGPALNSKQFLQATTHDQTAVLVAVGVPGTPMSAWSQDFSGPLTSEQIEAVSVYIRSWEEGAPDNPTWREGAAGEVAADTAQATAAPTPMPTDPSTAPTVEPEATATPEAITTPEATATPGSTPTDAATATAPTPEPTAVGSTGDPGDAELIAQGEELFLHTADGIGCAYCHGDDAMGDLEQASPDIRGNGIPEIVDALATRTRMTDMIVSDDEIKAIAAYIATLE